MDHDTGMPDNPDEVPGEHVTINQIVGYNVARWRKAAEFTQAELGERLGGWSNATVSAAEKSWDGKRIRQFSADDLIALTLALDVPLAALFLPPEDDGAAVRYLFHALGDACLDMHVLFGLLIPSSGGRGDAEDAWQAALKAAGRQYMEIDTGTDLVAYLEDMTRGERHAEYLARIRERRAAALGWVADLDKMALAIETEDRK